MQTNRQLRQHLVKLLKGGDAHADFDASDWEIPGEPCAAPGPNTRSIPHGRCWNTCASPNGTFLSSREIRVISRPNFQPAIGPGPRRLRMPRPGARSAEAFRKDLQALCDLVSDESTDLFAKIPHGEGQTVLREALVAADHNSYHLGELVLLRRILGAWE